MAGRLIALFSCALVFVSCSTSGWSDEEREEIYQGCLSRGDPVGYCECSTDWLTSNYTRDELESGDVNPDETLAGISVECRPSL
jgi:hypothetical protein